MALVIQHTSQSLIATRPPADSPKAAPMKAAVTPPPIGLVAASHPPVKYVQYNHPNKFIMHLPAKVLSWGTGSLQFVHDTMYDQTCRCGIVRQAVFISASGMRGIKVAVKILDKQAVAAAKDDWRSELQVMAELQPNGLQQAKSCQQIPLWDYRANADEPNIYIATEWAHGGTLESWARRHIRQMAATGRWNVWFSEVLPRVATQLLTGLAHMHTQGRFGVAHLDLDPVNIVMTHPGVDASLMFIDFGSSRLVDEQGLVGDEGIKWKFHFCAPDLHHFWARTIDKFNGLRADMFSAGAILWWVLAQPPAARFGDAHATRVVDIKKAWWVNLKNHADGLHVDIAAKRAEANMRAADAAISAAMAEVEAARRARQLAASARDMAMMNQASNVLVAAQERLSSANLHKAELREGCKVTLPFSTGECLCCRWGFNVPPKWRTLVVYSLLRDQSSIQDAISYMNREILGLRPPPARPPVESAHKVEEPDLAEVPSLLKLAEGGPPTSQYPPAGSDTSHSLLKPVSANPPPPPLQRQQSNMSLVSSQGSRPIVGIEPSDGRAYALPRAFGRELSDMSTSEFGYSMQPAGRRLASLGINPPTLSPSSSTSSLASLLRPPGSPCSLLSSTSDLAVDAVPWYPAGTSAPAAAAPSSLPLATAAPLALASPATAKPQLLMPSTLLSEMPPRHTGAKLPGGAPSSAAHASRKRSTVSPVGSTSPQSMCPPRPVQRMRSDTSLLADSVRALGH